MGGYDLSVNVIGWVVVAYGAGRVGWRSPWFAWTRVAAWTAAVASLTALWPALGQTRVVTLIDKVVITVVVFCLATAMLEAFAPGGRRGTIRQLEAIRLLVVALQVVTLVGASVRPYAIGFGNSALALGYIGGQIVLIWFVVLQLLLGGRPDFAEYAAPDRR